MAPTTTPTERCGKSGTLNWSQMPHSATYEDFVEGFRSAKEGGFALKPGVFRRFCKRARANPDIPHVFINRSARRVNER